MSSANRNGATVSQRSRRGPFREFVVNPPNVPHDPSRVASMIEQYAANSVLAYEPILELWNTLIKSSVPDVLVANTQPKHTMALLFEEAVNFLAPNYTIYEQTGALYALYVLYQTQNCNPKCKIRLTESRVELLLDLKSKYCELDAVQAFRCIELLRDHAVHFVCDGSLNSASSVPAPTSRPFIQLAAPLPLRSACTSLVSVASVGQLHAEYEQRKAQLFGSAKLAPLDMAVDLPQEMESNLNNFSAARQVLLREGARQHEEAVQLSSRMDAVQEKEGHTEDNNAEATTPGTAENDDDDEEEASAEHEIDNSDEPNQQLSVRQKRMAEVNLRKKKKRKKGD